MTTAERLGERLREWRQRRRLTQDALGEKVGSDGPRIHRLEKGSENPTIETLDKLAVALEIDVSELMLPRPVEIPTMDAGGRDRQTIDPALQQFVERLVATPEAGTWENDVIEALAALARALQRERDTGTATQKQAKAGR